MTDQEMTPVGTVTVGLVRYLNGHVVSKAWVLTEADAQRIEAMLPEPVTTVMAPSSIVHSAGAMLAAGAVALTPDDSGGAACL